MKKRRKRGQSPQTHKKTQEKLRLMKETEKHNERKIREWEDRRTRRTEGP